MLDKATHQNFTSIQMNIFCHLSKLQAWFELELNYFRAKEINSICRAMVLVITVLKA